MWNWLREKNRQKIEEAERHLRRRRAELQERRTSRRKRLPIRWTPRDDDTESQRTQRIERAWTRHDENMTLLNRMRQLGALDDDEYPDAIQHEKFRYQREVRDLLDFE